MTARVLRANGTKETLKGTGKRGKLTLEQMQAAVGGYIEYVHAGSKTLVVNEEGLLKGLPLNVMASDIAGRPIVGDALLVNTKDVG